MFSRPGNFQDERQVFPDNGPHYGNTPEFVKDNLVQFSPDFSALNDIYLDIDTPPIRPCNDGTTRSLDEPEMEDPPVVPLSCLGVLQNYARGIKRCSAFIEAEAEPEPQQGLSTDDILRLAGKKFIQTSSRKVGLSRRSSMNFPLVGLSSGEAKDVDLVQKLLSAAEKAGKKKYNQARKFLDECDNSSSDNGNQIERLVYHFSKALREKVDRETGRVYSRDSLKKQALNIDLNLMKPSPVIIAIHQAIPLSQTPVYAGMQTIIERVAGARRVHIIDLEIRSGLHTSVLMQALGDRIECPIELLKITAVTAKSKWIIEETGERLSDFARSIDLPFIFNIVSVPDIRDLSKDLFDFEPGETVVVNALYSLRNMLSRQDGLESVMRVLKSINPRVMVVTETEGKLNSPVFVNRFIEALFYFGAFFDCIEECMVRDCPLRKQSESIYFGFGIRNMIVAEGDERTYRHVNLNIWRAFFSRFGMKEEELSSLSLMQANLVAKTYACWKSCTAYKDEKSLIFGWKGMPLQHVSAWSFEQRIPNSVDD